MAAKKMHNFPEVKRWLTGKAAHTKQGYLTSLRTYVSFRGMNPQELIDEVEADRTKSKRQQGMVEVKVKEFFEWLTQEKDKQQGGWEVTPTGAKGLGERSAVTMLGAVRSFYRDNGFPLAFRMPRATVKKVNRKMVLRSEQVKQLVEHATSLRDRAIILMLFQSGMDVSTLCGLDFGDIAAELARYDKTGESPLAVRVVRKKQHIAYTTFLGRDGIDALQSYLSWRQKRLTALKHDEPLFIKERVLTKRQRITPRLIQKMLRELAVVTGLVSPEEMARADFNPCRPHALRAAFSSVMKLEGVNNEVVEYWMGHTVPYEAAYLIPEEDELRGLYRRQEEVVSIYPSVDSIRQIRDEMDGKVLDMNELLLGQKKEIDGLKQELRGKGSVIDMISREIAEEQEKHERFAELLTTIIQNKLVVIKSEVVGKPEEMEMTEEEQQKLKGKKKYKVPVKYTFKRAEGTVNRKQQ